MALLESSLTYASGPHGLVSVYDKESFSEEAFQFVLERVHAATEPERQWMAEASLPSYHSDEAILDAAHEGKLIRVSRGVGYIVRPMLANWDLSRSDPSHEYHYSPPYLRADAFEQLEDIGRWWAKEMGPSRLLAVVSLIRSDQYQENLARQERKLTIVNDEVPVAVGGELEQKFVHKKSAHQAGLAIDFDGIGHYREDGDGNIHAVNPLVPGSGWNSTLAAEGRLVLEDILYRKSREGTLNYIEELPGTLQRCFHVCAKPEELAA